MEEKPVRICRKRFHQHLEKKRRRSIVKRQRRKLEEGKSMRKLSEDHDSISMKTKSSISYGGSEKWEMSDTRNGLFEEVFRRRTKSLSQEQSKHGEFCSSYRQEESLGTKRSRVQTASQAIEAIADREPINMETKNNISFPGSENQALSDTRNDNSTETFRGETEDLSQQSSETEEESSVTESLPSSMEIESFRGEQCFSGKVGKSYKQEENENLRNEKNLQLNYLATKEPEIYEWEATSPRLRFTSLVTVPTTNRRYSCSSENQDRQNDPEEKFFIGDNDLVLMAEYEIYNSSVMIVSYGKVCEMGISLEKIQSKFLLGVLRGIEPGTKLFARASGGVQISSSDRVLDNSEKLIPIETLKTSVYFQAVGCSPEADGTLAFVTAKGSQAMLETVLEVDVKFLQFSFTMKRRLELPKLKRSNDGYVIVEKSKEWILAHIIFEEELKQLISVGKLELSDVRNFIIHLDLRKFSQQFIKEANPLDLVIDTLELHTLQTTDKNLKLVLTEKFPRLKKLIIHGSYFRWRQQSTWKLTMNKLPEDPFLGNYLLNVFSPPPKSHQIQSLELWGLKIHFNSNEEMIQFREAFEGFSKSREKFNLDLTHISVTNGASATSSSFVFLALLTSENIQLANIEELMEIYANNQRDMEKIDQLSMTFFNGKLANLKISAQICPETIDEIIKINKCWRLWEAENYNLENLSLIYGNSDYSWLFQLNNMHEKFDMFCNGIENFTFDRENMNAVIEILSSKEPAKNSNTMLLEKIVVHVALHDSRSEMRELISELCEILAKVSIKIDQLEFNIESDDSGWAFFRFTLTKLKTIVNAKGISIQFPKDSTDDLRVVSLEIHSIPNDLIERVNFENGTNVCLSPLVCINQKEDVAFLQPVSIYFLYPHEGQKIKTRIFSKYPQTPCEDNTKSENLPWQQVPGYTATIQRKTYKLSDFFLESSYTDIFDNPDYTGLKLICYESRHFSPVIATSETEGTEGTPLGPAPFTDPYFADTTFVTILPLQTRKGNVVFDCIKAKGEAGLENSVISEYFEKRKVKQMNVGDELFATCARNLEVEEPQLEDGNRLHFYYPYHDSNEQEYKMKKMNIEGDWRGFIHYYLKSGESEKKLFHMGYHIPSEPMRPVVREQNQNASDHSSQPSTSDERRSCLEKAWFKLHRNIQQSSLICSYLFSKKEMPEDKAEEIQSEKVKQNRNLKLIKHVLACGSRAYDKFREAMIEVEEPRHLIDLLPKFDDTSNSNDLDEPCTSLESLQIGEEIPEEQ